METGRPQILKSSNPQTNIGHALTLTIYINMHTIETGNISSCRILWSTQSGRSKACARRTARILRQETTLVVKDIGSSFDEAPENFIDLASNLADDSFLLIFISTTGDGEHCDSIRDTWKILLQKSLPRNLFQGKQFAMFCLGDRAYGPKFCAAGRKLAVRLMQLGMIRNCDVGYGDDNTPNGGVFRDLDDWLEQHLLTLLEKRSQDDVVEQDECNPFDLKFVGDEAIEEQTRKAAWQDPRFQESFRDYFTQSCPINAHSYDTDGNRKIHKTEKIKTPPLQGEILVNNRITAPDWEQDSRHIEVSLQSTEIDKSSDSVYKLPYCAGDIATILPFNSDQEVHKFLEVLPKSIRTNVDHPLEINLDERVMNNSHTRWPRYCTLRFLLKYCADIHSLPEREDLRALSRYCSLDCEVGKNQSEKLMSLSETSEAALFADYILREKRSWADVLYDFESLRAPTSRLTIESLLLILSPMRPRDFSIASSPSYQQLVKSQSSDDSKKTFTIELCVAVVLGRTRLGRAYHGLCSEYLSRMNPSTTRSASKTCLQVWIRPGTFGGLPTELNEKKSFTVPVLCVCAGTGIAPLRALLLERDAVRNSFLGGDNGEAELSPDENDNILVFGCRKESCDYYYKDEWQKLAYNNQIRILTAFSRDQAHKVYVQKVLAEADGGRLIAKHILEKEGALYIAGGPQMARAVKDEVVEALGRELKGGEKQANQLLNKLQRVGKFSIEAWS